MHLCLPLALLLAGLLCLGEHLPPSRKASNRQPHHLHASSTRSTTRTRWPSPSSLSQPVGRRLSTSVKEKSAMIQDRSVLASTDLTKRGNKENPSPGGHTLSYRNLNAAIAQHREENKEASIPGPSGMPIVKQANTGQTKPRQQFYDGSNTPTTFHDVLASEPDCQPCSCQREKGDGLIVNCSGRALSHVPGTLPIEAMQLLMANNNLSVLGAGKFSRFYRLHVLDLSVNVISNLSRETFQGLSSLRVLHLHGNQLRYTADVFTAEVLAPLRSLRRLTLHNNTADMAEDLDYPDLALSRLPLLETLSLDGLTNRSFGEGFAKLVNLWNLSLSGHDGFCHLETIYYDTFENTPNLRLLNLTRCDLKFVGAESFLSMRNIDTLDVSQNTKLGFDFLSNATYGLQNSSIRVLMINEMYGPFQTCVTITKEHVQYLQNTNLEELQAKGNNLEMIEKGALLALPKNISNMIVGGNKLVFGQYYIDFLGLENLVSLNLDYYQQQLALPNLISTYTTQLDTSQNMCGSAGTPSDPLQLFHPTVENFKQRYLGSGIFLLPLPPRLKELSMRHRAIDYELTHIEFTRNVLETLDLSSNLLKIWKGPIKNVPHLKFLDLSTNFASVWTKDFMAYAYALEVLDISENLLSDVLAREDSGDLLENQRNLRDLSMSSNGIYSLPRLVFRGLSSLQRLYLYGNRIAAEGFNASLSHMVNLSFLDLSYNVFDRLQPATCAMLDQLARGGNSSLTVNLNSNPLACTCGNRAFLSWLRDTPVHIFKREQLQCVLDNGTVVHLWSQVDALDGRCVETMGLFMGSAVGSLLILVILVGLVVYRYRWKLRYLYYAARGHYRREQGAREEFRYDAFLSYAEEDSQWVTGQLLPHLEGGHNLRVCLHQRDFLPGKTIISNIVDAVQTSRRTVCVLSPDFLESYWCLYEMQMAKMEGLHTGRDAVLLLLYQPLRADALPREVVCYMHTESYLEYPRDPRCLAVFYDNLGLALRQP